MKVLFRPGTVLPRRFLIDLIRTLSDSGPRKLHSQVDTQYRVDQFKELFSDFLTDTTKVNEDYFDGSNGRQSRHCSQILTAFGKIKSSEIQKCYLETCSVEKWESLTQHSKRRHTVASCFECAIAHPNLQQLFQGPKYQPTQSFMHEVQLLSRDVPAS